ncbi:hypothetical protein D9619_003567 [Psilocybe cf. subviscida]|uniref:Uncharacterized protein n=1 Tax=Psilocybe cf. subviscida TaxID=2480587 RepID=A0A8H5AYN0_9AGAR|nr:hypothetical protein D9619_003567 [Psilocybe cf. subviscida]
MSIVAVTFRTKSRIRASSQPRAAPPRAHTGPCSWPQEDDYVGVGHTRELAVYEYRSDEAARSSRRRVDAVVIWATDTELHTFPWALRARYQHH